MKIENNKDIESRILEAAKVVFVRKGYEATKMGDIAAEVGISRTAMHYYFRTKETLFDAILGQLLENLLPNIDIIMEEDSTILEKMPKIMELYILSIQNNPLFPIFVVNEMNRDPEHLYRTILKEPEKITPILRLREQVLEEMENGLLKKRPLIEIGSGMLSLIVFPLLARHPLTTVFFERDKEAFNEFLQNRKKLICDIMYYIMTPDQK